MLRPRLNRQIKNKPLRIPGKSAIASAEMSPSEALAFLQANVDTVYEGPAPPGFRSVLEWADSWCLRRSRTKELLASAVTKGVAEVQVLKRGAQLTKYYRIAAKP